MTDDATCLHLSLHFLHLHHVPAAELDTDFVELSALPPGFHPRGNSITIDLLDGLVRLLLGSLLGISRLRQVFQFQDLTVLRLIMSHVRQKEEIEIVFLLL